VRRRAVMYLPEQVSGMWRPRNPGWPQRGQQTTTRHPETESKQHPWPQGKAGADMSSGPVLSSSRTVGRELNRGRCFGGECRCCRGEAGCCWNHRSLAVEGLATARQPCWLLLATAGCGTTQQCHLAVWEGVHSLDATPQAASGCRAQHSPLAPLTGREAQAGQSRDGLCAVRNPGLHVNHT